MCVGGGGGTGGVRGPPGEIMTHTVVTMSRYLKSLRVMFLLFSPQI